MTVIVSKPVEHRAMRLVHSLTPRLIDAAQSAPALELMQGTVGYALVLSHLGAAGISGATDAALTAVERAVEQFNAQGAGPGLHTGLAGLGWCLHALVDAPQLLEQIDQALLAQLERWGDEPLTSLREGLAGIGLYAHVRRGTTTGAALGEAVVRRICQCSVASAEGVWWPTPRAYAVRRGIDSTASALSEWGCAHGVAPLALTLAAWGSEFAAPALEWIWRSTSSKANRFGWLWEDGGQVTALNAFTWCTGDAGVAACSAVAAKACGSARLKDALELGRSLAERVVQGERPGLPERIDLCCGLAGVLQCFSRLAALDVDAVWAGAIERLATMLLDEADRGPQLNNSLQFGWGGVALALLSVSRPEPPEWDGAFALSLPSSCS